MVDSLISCHFSVTVILPILYNVNQCKVRDHEVYNYNEERERERWLAVRNDRPHQLPDGVILSDDGRLQGTYLLSLRGMIWRGRDPMAHESCQIPHTLTQY